MSAGYVIAQLRVTNPENYKEYIEKVNPIVKKFDGEFLVRNGEYQICLLYTSPSPRDVSRSRMPSSA